ncbi:hypothetical protein DXG03_002999 [Asterophora parasitica]|uniref:Uncharacterized protein n=1 Tax=Asterophora parasitica TaxID=117018 RepID=A0A9P7G1S3_9AGAR|nr:hypothetical protein DXG03_002999 [Asterophora parasitica]
MHCSGPGPSNCLACSSSSQVLRAGSCVSANCQGTSTVIPGLGVCLSDLIQVPSATTGAPALPTVTGLVEPTSTSRRALEWWQILLMTLGCAFIFLMFIMCWRRRARKQRAKQTALFVSVKRLDRNMTWRGRLVRFGERFFGHKPRQPILLPTTHAHTHPGDGGEMKLRKMREAEDARYDNEYDLDQFIDAYDYPDDDSRHYNKGAEALPALDDPSHRSFKTRRKPPPSFISRKLSSGHSLFYEVTGKPRQMPEPRQPVRKDLLAARYSSSTLSSFSIRSRGEHDRVHAPAPPVPTEAEAYKLSVRPAISTPSPPAPQNPGSYWLQPTNTGGSTRNPFRQL